MEPEEQKSAKRGVPSVKSTPKGGVGVATGRAKAVIGGLACRLPKSRNVQEYWQNLVNGVDMIGPTRWPDGLYGLPPRIGAVLEEDKFDNDFFNISDKEASNLNPMLRHLLEVVHECVADSCLPLSTLQQATTGIYLATFGSDYDFIETSRNLNTDHVSVSPFLAGELARSLKIQGPLITVDTACSSSIAALNMAVNAIVSGRCTYAIVASCNMILNPLFSQQMFLLSMLCKEGLSRVFDKAAAGYVRAEGFGALLLAGQDKLIPIISYGQTVQTLIRQLLQELSYLGLHCLQKALKVVYMRDPSHFPRVYANIKGIGVNCDGYKPKGITYPNSQTQAKLLKRVYEKAGVDVNDIKYVEAHGTGTQAGDTMETEGIESIFCEGRTEPLLIGSVKSNIGHTEATAGLASIIKCIMCLKQREVPGNLNFQEPNPSIKGLASGKLKVVDKKMPLNSKYIGVNSFGFGGVNGHVILEPFREVRDSEDFVHVPRHLVVPLTVRNPEGVTTVAEFVGNNRYNASLLSILSKSLLSTDYRQPIRGYIQIGPKEEVCSEAWEEELPSVYLCLDGLLSNKVLVASDLLENDTFMKTLKDCSKSIKKVYPSLDIVPVLKKGEPLLSCSRVGILAATALVITLFDCLDQAGVPFEGMVGCGVTEVIGAYLDGCLGLDQCFGIMDLIGRELENFANEAGDRWVLYDVTMDIENVYRLGPWIQVLSIQDTDHVTIAVETSHKDEVLTKIHSRGGVFDILSCNIPLYSDHMVDFSQKIRKRIRDIVPAPKYWSGSFISSHQGWYCKGKKTMPQLCNADYISRLVCKPVNLYTATKQLHEDRLLLKLIPTSSPGAYFKMPDRFGHHVTQNFSMMVEVSGSRSQSLGSDSMPRSSKGLSQSSYAQSGLDESLSEGSYSCKKSQVNLQCFLTTESLCRALGELHMAGHQPSVHMLYPKVTKPLGLDTPSLSPLVTWDHSAQWDIPHWMEFSCRGVFRHGKEFASTNQNLQIREKDHEHLYKISTNPGCGSKDICSPVAVMLSEVWQALTYKLATAELQTIDDLVPAVKLYDLNIPEESTLTIESLDGALIQILDGLKLFAVIANETLLMSGKFKVEETLSLPNVPGYDLDINENVQTSPGSDRESQCEKTELKWEDAWDRFIGECVDFASLYLEPPLLEFTVDWYYNEKEAKECSVFLAVIDKSTGICRSGGCALQYRPVVPTSTPEVTLGQVAVDNPESVSISKLMVYSLSGNQTTTDRVIVCQAEKDKGECSSVPVLGMINIHGDKLMREIPLPSKWQPGDLEVVVPYLLASHILYTIAKIQDFHKVLVLPPIDSVEIYIISLASKMGCSVFTSTYDVESLQTLELMFPYIRVIQGERLYEDLVTLTQGKGADVCIRVSGGDIQTALKCVSKNGHLIQGIPPPKGSSRSINMNGKSCRISMFRPLDAVSAFMDKTVEEAEVLLYDMKCESVAQLSTEGFPEPKGILYNQDNVSSFLQPIALDRLITLITEPNLGNMTGDLMEADIICVEKIQSLVAPKPKDYSIADTSCVLKTTAVAKVAGEDMLDCGMIVTPDKSIQIVLGTKARKGPEDLVDHGLIMTPVPSNNRCEILSPDVNIISFIDADLSKMSPKKGKEEHFTSTPMMDTVCANGRDKPLEESYIDTARDNVQILEPSSIDKEGTGDKKVAEGLCSQGEHKDQESETMSMKENQPKYSKPNRKPGMTPKRSKVIPPTIVVSDASDHDHKSQRCRLPQSPGSSRVDSPRSKVSMKEGSFQQLMKQKAKLVPPQLLLPKPQVDLLKISMPMTPVTPALKEILTPRMESNLVPLNTLKAAKETPLYIIHPVTGSTSVLEALGEQLKIPCIGIKRTGATPSDCISNVASFYRNAITLTQPEGPYRICGYSYGSMIAFEMALQLQAAGHKVEKLIFLDGSPMYVQSQISSGLKHLPTNATKAQIDEALEVGGLVNWMKLYGVTQELTVTYGLLRKIPSTEDRINTAVDLTFGNAIVSSNRSKTKWLTAREKLLKHHSPEEKKDKFADAAKELMRHMRREKASMFIHHITMASHYQILGKFDGDISLHRVKALAIFEAVDLPADYGVSKLCTGQVSVKFYDGDHESFLNKHKLAPLVKDLHQKLDAN